MKTRFGIVGFIALLSTVAALAFTVNDDTVKLGKKGSSSNKQLTFDTGDGASNKKIQINNSTKAITINSNDITIGDGAASNKTLTFDKGGSNAQIRYNNTNTALEFSNDGTNFNAFGSGSGSGGGVNIISTNPELESGTVGLTASAGTLAAVTAGSNLLFGTGSATWDASAGSQTLRTSAYTIPNGLYNRSCIGRIYYKGGDANLSLRVLDGSNVLISGATTTLVAASDVTSAYVTFVCPSSGSLKLELLSGADAAIIAIDRLYLGEMDLLQQVSQATFIGSLKYAKTTNCLWSVTQTSFAADFAADTDCPTPTVTGSLTAPGTKVPGFEVTLSPGKYLVVANNAYAPSTSNQATFGLFANGSQFGAQVASDLNGALHVSGVLDVVATTAYSIRVRAAAASGSVNIDLTTLYESNLEFTVFKFPTTVETVFRPDDIAQSWSGYHDLDCTWTTSSTSLITPLADASCTFTERSNQNFGTVASTGSKTPGITFTPTKPGKYFVCARVSIFNDGANEAKTVLTDGTNIIAGFAPKTSGGYYTAAPLCGVVTAASTSALSLNVQIGASAGNTTLQGTDGTSKPIEWTIFKLDTKFPAPVLVGGLSTDSSSGVEKVCRMRIAAPGGGFCSVVSQSGCVSGTPTSGATAQCAISFVASTFSSTPTCTCNASGTSSPHICMLNTMSSSGITTVTANDAGAAAGTQVDVICMGPK